MAKSSKAGRLLRYDVLSLSPDQLMLDRWPELRRYSEFIRHALTAQGDMILRLVVLLTDIGSPYPRLYPDLPERKVKAMRRVGLKPNAQLGRVLKAWQHDGAREMAIRYLRIQHHMELAAALASEEALWQNIAKVQAPIESEFEDDEDGPEWNEAEGGENAKPTKKKRNSFKSEEDKEASRQQAYKTRNQLEAALPAQVERVKRQMAAIFKGDNELQAAVADAYEDALKNDGDSVESEYMGPDADDDEEEDASDPFGLEDEDEQEDA